jgi:hypothetical protein
MGSIRSSSTGALSLLFVQLLLLLLPPATLSFQTHPVQALVVSPPSSLLQRRDSSVVVLKDATGWDNFCVEDEDNRSALRSSPEIARRFRRTVYTHDDWKKHRQQDRFTIYLGSMFKSGIFENSKNEVLSTTAFAMFLCLYNALAGGYTDLVGVAHPPILPGVLVVGLPMNVFTLTGSSLGLLLSK